MHTYFKPHCTSPNHLTLFQPSSPSSWKTNSKTVTERQNMPHLPCILHEIFPSIKKYVKSLFLGYSIKNRHISSLDKETKTTKHSAVGRTGNQFAIEQQTSLQSHQLCYTEATNPPDPPPITIRF